MKKYVLVGALALALSACGGGEKEMATAQASPDDLMQQAQQAYERGDKAMAVEILQPIATAGNPVAQYNLSTLYLRGDGVAQNEQMALDLLSQAAAQNYAPALNDMGNFYLQQQRAEQAAPLLQAAAEQGSPSAQFNLGVMLVRGDGVEKNEQAGIALIQQSAARGFAPAIQALQQAQ